MVPHFTLLEAELIQLLSILTTAHPWAGPQHSSGNRETGRKGCQDRQGWARTEVETGYGSEGNREGNTNQKAKESFLLKATQAVDGGHACVLWWQRAAHSRMLAE